MCSFTRLTSARIICVQSKPFKSTPTRSQPMAYTKYPDCNYATITTGAPIPIVITEDIPVGHCIPLTIGGITKRYKAECSGSTVTVQCHDFEDMDCTKRPVSVPGLSVIGDNCAQPTCQIVSYKEQSGTNCQDPGESKFAFVDKPCAPLSGVDVSVTCTSSALYINTGESCSAVDPVGTVNYVEGVCTDSAGGKLKITELQCLIAPPDVVPNPPVEQGPHGKGQGDGHGHGPKGKGHNRKKKQKRPSSLRYQQGHHVQWIICRGNSTAVCCAIILSE